jgi:hypothetical protein
MKKILNSLLASVLCLGTALPAFAATNPNTNSSSVVPVGSQPTLVLIQTPSGNPIFSTSLTAQQAGQIAAILPALKAGQFGVDIQQSVNSLFPETPNFSGGTTVTVTAQIDNLAKAIAAFNRGLTPSFLGSLSVLQRDQITELSNLLKELRAQVPPPASPKP